MLYSYALMWYIASNNKLLTRYAQTSVDNKLVSPFPPPFLFETKLSPILEYEGLSGESRPVGKKGEEKEKEKETTPPPFLWWG